MNRLRTNAVLLAAIAALSSQANAQVIEAEREAAQKAYVAGDFFSAKELLSELLLQSPSDPDLLRRLAAVQAALNDVSAAQAMIDQAIGLAPDDPDIQLARANILFWRGYLSEARAQARQVAMKHPGYPGLYDMQETFRRAGKERRFQLRSLGVANSISKANFASGSNQIWYAQRGSISTQWAGRNIAVLDVERAQRLARDTRISGRIDLPLGQSRYFVAGSITPKSDFRESWSVSGGAEIGFGITTTLKVDGRFAQYRDDNVVAIGAGLGRRISPELEISARSIHLFGGGEGHRLGGILRADYRHPRIPEIFAIAASYPDVEADGTRQLQTVAAGSRFALSEKITLGLTGEFESRKSSYERAALVVDLRLRIGE